MRLVVIGSGDAANGGGRGHSCYWIERGPPRPPVQTTRETPEPTAGDVMVDFGGTALMGLKRLGRDSRALRTLCITHLHGDHIGGFPFLLIDALYEVPRTEPLHVIGPVGVEERLTALSRLMYGSVIDRERTFDLTFAELRPGEATPLPGGGQVRGFAADHQDPPEQPLCLRVEADGRALAFSGDTRPCEGLLAAAAGADVLVAECSHLGPPAGGHTSWEQWQQRLFGQVEARAVVLTHLTTPVRLRVPDLTQQAPGGRSVRFAEDGLTVEFAAPGG